MRRQISLLITLLFCFNTFVVSAEHFSRQFLIRAKEKTWHTSAEIEAPFTSRVLNESTLAIEGVAVATIESGNQIEDAAEPKPNDSTMAVYEELMFEFTLSLPDNGLKYKDSPDLQEDIIKEISARKHNHPIAMAVCDAIKTAKTFEEAFSKIKKMEGYNVFCNDDIEKFTVEENRPDVLTNFTIEYFELEKEGGILKSNLNSIYDAESGKRIQVTDLLKSVRIQNAECFITGIKYIECNHIMFNLSCADPSWNEILIKKGDPRLTPYAEKLMGKANGFKTSTYKNAFPPDSFKVYKFRNVNGSYEDKKVYLPEKIYGCKSTEKVRNRMLDVMFGKSDYDTECRIVAGIKNWVSDYGRGSKMSFICGQGLLSFGFEDQSKHNNSNNTFIVFDRATGDEISVNELIKDKDGFMGFVNSHNLYMAGYIFDTTRVESFEKYGSEMRSYLKHSAGYFGQFNGLEEFPTSWWTVFGKMGKAFPMEFNTREMRIFLDYYDIREYIDPKYLEILDKEAKAISTKQ